MKWFTHGNTASEGWSWCEDSSGSCLAPEHELFINKLEVYLNIIEDTFEDEDCEFIVAPRCEVMLYFFLQHWITWISLQRIGTKQGGFWPCGWDGKQGLEDFRWIDGSNTKLDEMEGRQRRVSEQGEVRGPCEEQM